MESCDNAVVTFLRLVRYAQGSEFVSLEISIPIPSPEKAGAGRSGGEAGRVDDRRFAGDLRAAVFLVVLLAAFFATVFFAAVFFAATRFVVVFFAGDFLAGVFRPAAARLFTAFLPRLVFAAAARLAGFFRAVLFVVFRAAGFRVVFPPLLVAMIILLFLYYRMATAIDVSGCRKNSAQ